mmetsp:Transcript_74501/g.223969  ORF Transcript_74501/g.223969 Transcript_74501/m.223969 type:complete len:216 (+) Transcript_74501:1317-1964(+)
MHSSAAQAGSTRPPRAAIKSTRHGTAPSSKSIVAAVLEPLARTCISVAAVAASSTSCPAPSMHSTSTLRDSRGTRSTAPSVCWTESASARHAWRRISASRWLSSLSTWSVTPSLCRASASSAVCFAIDPRKESATRRIASDASFTHVVSTKLTAPLSSTCAAISSVWSAIPARHQTAARRVSRSTCSRRSQSAGSSRQSIAACAVSFLRVVATVS